MAITLFRALGSATGLSSCEGEPVRVPSDLPDHRIEIHRFTDENGASAFVAGLSLAGNPNKIAWDHETGTREQNRSVIVAKLDEPRPEGSDLAACLVVVEHRRGGHDQRDFEASMRRIHAERDAGCAAARERTAALRSACEAAGIRFEDASGGWVRTDHATFEPGGGSVRASFAEHDRLEETQTIAARKAEAAQAAGFRPGEGRGEYEGGPYPDAASAVAAHLSFGKLCETFDAIRKEEWQKAFMAGMRMTPSRKRFLAAAVERGRIELYRHRNNLRASAGGIEVKAGEYGDLLRAGWIESTGPHEAQVTPAGREAAGLPEAAAGPAP
jgi:hypothetical protein